MKTHSFLRRTLAIAAPVALQIMFTSCFGLIDQLMVGSLGSESITAIGVANKVVALYTTILGSVSASASIFFAQYYGAKDAGGLGNSMRSHMILAAAPMLLFVVGSLLYAPQIMGVFSTDGAVIDLSAKYLRIAALGYAPLALTYLLSGYLRTVGRARVPMISGFCSVLLNTALNWLLIYGMLGIPALGVSGAAWATTLARLLECAVLTIWSLCARGNEGNRFEWRGRIPKAFWKSVLLVLSPALLGDIVWGLGEAAYGVIYARIGTEEMAAMTLTSPLQNLTFGMFVGLSTATGVLVGERLGGGQEAEATHEASRLFKLGLVVSAAVGVVLACCAGLYVRLYNVPPETLAMSRTLLYVFSALLPVKVANLVLMCGILPSGGRTDYDLMLNALGTWGIGVPLGFLSAFVFKLPLPLVFLLINMEECVRMIIGIVLFRRGNWRRNLTEGRGGDHVKVA